MCRREPGLGLAVLRMHPETQTGTESLPSVAAAPLNLNPNVREQAVQLYTEFMLISFLTLIVIINSICISISSFSISMHDVPFRHHDCHLETSTSFCLYLHESSSSPTRGWGCTVSRFRLEQWESKPISMTFQHCMQGGWASRHVKHAGFIA